MENYKKTLACLRWASICLSLLSSPLWAFESNSNGIDGALTPTADTIITVPRDGILQYTTIDIPEGVTVRFVNDVTGPVVPATILVQGDAIIDGTIDMSGNNGNAELGALQAAGGFAGGIPQVSGLGGRGQGPGGGRGANVVVNQSITRGAGASHRSTGFSNDNFLDYGSESLQPLLGGSGGGSASTALITGGVGGDGGGAILLAVSGTLTLNGSILADGGNGVPLTQTAGVISTSGGGSGGAVRLVASLLEGDGTISVNGGRLGDDGSNFARFASVGRIRLEANVINFNGTAQAASILNAEPVPIALSNFPTVRISRVAGNAVPVSPTGINDIILPPATLSNPVTIEFAATQVPTGSTIELRVKPVTAGQGVFRRFSAELTGSLESSTASVEVTLPTGASTLLASVNFLVTPSTAALYEPFADGEQVAQVKVESALGGGPSVMTLVTESGRVIEVPAYANL